MICGESEACKKIETWQAKQAIRTTFGDQVGDLADQVDVKWLPHNKYVEAFDSMHLKPYSIESKGGEILGFYNGGSVYIDQDAGQISTVTHEVLHGISHISGWDTGPTDTQFNEGVTQWLTKLASEKVGLPYAENIYKTQVLAVEELANKVGASTIQTSYFKGGMYPLKQAIGGLEAWDTFLNKFNARHYVDAIEMVP